MEKNRSKKVLKHGHTSIEEIPMTSIPKLESSTSLDVEVISISSSTSTTNLRKNPCSRFFDECISIVQHKGRNLFGNLQEAIRTNRESFIVIIVTLFITVAVIILLHICVDDIHRTDTDEEAKSINDVYVLL